MQPDLTGFTLIIDDIVRPDGKTYMQQLGGGGECGQEGVTSVA
jgi:hypothetical protein